jgi:hypothetical protein
MVVAQVPPTVGTTPAGRASAHVAELSPPTNHGAGQPTPTNQCDPATDECRSQTRHPARYRCTRRAQGRRLPLVSGWALAFCGHRIRPRTCRARCPARCESSPPPTGTPPRGWGRRHHAARRSRNPRARNDTGISGWSASPPDIRRGEIGPHLSASGAPKSTIATPVRSAVRRHGRGGFRPRRPHEEMLWTVSALRRVLVGPGSRPSRHQAGRAQGP